MRTIRNIAEYYDWITPVYLKYTNLFQVGRTFEDDFSFCMRLAAAMRLKGTERVLDCGCGTGYFLRFLKSISSGITGFGITLSETQTKLSNDNDVFVADFQNLPFSNDSFDYLYFHESIGYGDIEKTLTEAYRVLGPSGKIYIKDPCRPAHADPAAMEAICASWMYDFMEPTVIEGALDGTGFKRVFSREIPIMPNPITIHMLSDPEIIKRHPLYPCDLRPIHWEFLYSKIRR